MKRPDRREMSWREFSGAEAAKLAAGGPVLRSGSASLDGLVGGGYRAGRLTEFFGRSNSWKTQVAMQAALVAAAAGVSSVFLDSEGGFRPERMAQMAEARGWDQKGLLQKTVYLRTDSAAEQSEVVRGLAKRGLTGGCGLVVVDTLSRNFTLDFPGQANLRRRQEALAIHLSEMARDAVLERRAYLLTNRVTFAGDESDVPIGGSTVAQFVHDSVRLERRGDGVVATNERTARSCTLKIGAAGVE